MRANVRKRTPIYHPIRTNDETQGHSNTETTRKRRQTDTGLEMKRDLLGSKKTRSEPHAPAVVDGKIRCLTEESSQSKNRSKQRQETADIRRRQTTGYLTSGIKGHVGHKARDNSHEATTCIKQTRGDTGHDDKRRWTSDKSDETLDTRQKTRNTRETRTAARYKGH